jgi:Ca2+/H+ antiporter
MGNLLNKKVLESALNAFVIALVTQFVDAGADLSVLTGETLGTILNSAVAAAAWVVIRAVNPKDSKFGLGSKSEPAKTTKKTPAKKSAVKK